MRNPLVPVICFVIGLQVIYSSIRLVSGLMALSNGEHTTSDFLLPLGGYVIGGGFLLLVLKLKKRCFVLEWDDRGFSWVGKGQPQSWQPWSGVQKIDEDQLIFRVFIEGKDRPSEIPKAKLPEGFKATLTQHQSRAEGNSLED